MIRILTAIANTTFCHATRNVALDKSRICAIAVKDGRMNTTSAASIAASAPLPIAPPTSAPASTGASLMPSPTNMVGPYSERISCTTDNLS